MEAKRKMKTKTKTKTKTKMVEPGVPSPLGVRLRGKGGFHLEVRTGSRGCKKIHVARFGRDRELAKMAHDLARRCHLGEEAFLALCEGKLNFWGSRGAVADLVRGDARMAKLADAHRRKDEGGENWDAEMKSTLRELASDVLRRIKDASHEAAEAQPVDSQNFNVGYGDEGPSFDIDGGLRSGDGAAPENWPHRKEALRSLSPELPELPLEVQLDILRNENARLGAALKAVCGDKAGLEAENQMLKASLSSSEAENKTLRASLSSQRLPECHGLQSSGDYQTMMQPALSPELTIFDYDLWN